MTHLHPGVELRANLKSISYRCYLFEVEFVWKLTKETFHLPLSCLQGRLIPEVAERDAEVGERRLRVDRGQTYRGRSD